ncbi:hypothetical protein EDEG_03475 [Edhazardia aedis USNM 41457]|uniref:Uncharacterized protein n=1 Tax=Edhazardia aedis (strain USNM 41457) TaxID=1003232 RepID=J8ZQX2_EDHAE|nr:hypothetical protein EDEG_03475 [Edhazardia aedis USNM 41457]|eukprot:EJW02073.1 hypothetical protein EDEG_03475 [Edhazardia aedis USNM 41457]
MNQNNSEKSKKQILIIIAASISVIILLTSGFVVWGRMHIKNVEKSAKKAYCAFDKIVQSESDSSIKCSKEITTPGYLLIRRHNISNTYDFCYRKKSLNISKYEEHKNLYLTMLDKQYYNSNEAFEYRNILTNVIRTNRHDNICVNTIKVSSDIKIKNFKYNKGFGHGLIRLFTKNNAFQFDNVYKKICNILVATFKNTHVSQNYISVACFVEDLELQIITVESKKALNDNLRGDLELKSYFYKIKNDKNGAKMFNILQAVIYHVEKAIHQKKHQVNG